MQLEALLRPRDRQPRPQVVRAALRLDPVRHQRRGRPRQPAGRPPPPARRRRRRHRARGARRRPLHRPGPPGRRHRRARARGRHRRARHRPDRRHRDLRRDPAHPGRPQPLRRPLPARLPPGRVQPGSAARGPAEAALPGPRPHRRQRRARPDGRVGQLLQQGDGLREHGGVHRRRHRHRLLRADEQGRRQRQPPGEVPAQRAGDRQEASRRSTSTSSSTAAPAPSTSRVATNDILASVDALRANGVEFLDTPDSYYEDPELRARIGKVRVPIEELQRRKHPGRPRRGRLPAADLHQAARRPARRCSSS